MRNGRTSRNGRAIVSSVIPSPPGSAMLRSTTRQMTATPLGPVQRKQITQDERRF
jgi:hypothetical protein